MYMLVSKLSVSNIGITAMNLFTVDMNTIVTVSVVVQNSCIFNQTGISAA